MENFFEERIFGKRKFEMIILFKQKVFKAVITFIGGLFPILNLVIVNASVGVKDLNELL